jgi:hypothetical protein
VLKIRLFVKKLSFLHPPQEISFFRETVRTRMDCRDLHAKKFIGFFWQLEIYFLGGGIISAR